MGAGHRVLLSQPRHAHAMLTLHHIPLHPCGCAAAAQAEQHNPARAGAQHRTAHPTACLAVSSALLALSTSESSCGGMDGLQDTVISILALRGMVGALQRCAGLRWHRLWQRWRAVSGRW